LLRYFRQLAGSFAAARVIPFTFLGVEEHLQSFILVLEGEQVVGCAGLKAYGDAGLLRSVAVNEQCRSHGLGEKLTRGILELAQHKNLST